MIFYLETERSKELGYRYEVRTGDGITTVNVQRVREVNLPYVEWEDIDCFTLAKNVTPEQALEHIKEWENEDEED